MTPAKRRLDPASATGTVPKSSVVISCEEGPIHMSENLENPRLVFSPGSRSASNLSTSLRQNQEIFQPVSISTTERFFTNAKENLNNRLIEGDGTRGYNGVRPQR